MRSCGEISQPQLKFSLQLSKLKRPIELQALKPLNYLVGGSVPKPGPSDSVSNLALSPKANFLIATSWDNQVLCWEISKNDRTSLNTTLKASISHDHPVLCSTWKDDGTTVFSGGCDKQVKMWPLLSGGKPDKTVKYWDTRQPNPVHTQQLPDRC
ncbi:Transducin/WD40 repeat superfamily protein [Trifolium repens]|nr:Transducin/WD40 repeat superfamily protein [Trifolium repens]